MRATGFPPKVRQQIVERSSGRCEVMASGCTFTAQEIHHRRPRGMGGTNRGNTNAAVNGLACCLACHRRIESDRDWAYGRGFLVRQNVDPATVPVRKGMVGEKPPPGPDKPRRNPLPAQANTAGWALRKAVERIERILDDDRFPQQREKVAASLRSHLITAINTCQEAIDRINTTQEES